MIIGAYYKNGYGQLKGPMVINMDELYPFRVEDGCELETYTKDGIYSLFGQRSKLNLDISNPLKADGSPWKTEHPDYSKIPTVEEQKKFNEEMNERIKENEALKSLDLPTGPGLLSAMRSIDLTAEEINEHLKKLRIKQKQLEEEVYKVGLGPSINPHENDPFSRQVGGSHYLKYPIKPTDYCMKNKLDTCQSNIVKYVTRFRDKDGLKDLEKAKHYLDMLIQYAKDEGIK